MIQSGDLGHGKSPKVDGLDLDVEGTDAEVEGTDTDVGASVIKIDAIGKNGREKSIKAPERTRTMACRPKRH